MNKEQEELSDKEVEFESWKAAIRKAVKSRKETINIDTYTGWQMYSFWIEGARQQTPNYTLGTITSDYYAEL